MIKFICPKCNKEINVTNFANKANHIRWCDTSIKSKFNTYDWKLYQDEYDNLHSWVKVAKKFHKSKKIMEMGVKKGFLKSHKFFHTEETKKHMSEIRKQYLKDHPETHCWKSNNKFKSEPCEKFKKILKNKNISFVEEYQPLKDRFFSIDIAFPNDKIGIEINGNQHYNKEGILKKYYMERHQIIENSGWKLYEIPYNKVYDNNFINEFLKNIQYNIDMNIIYKPYIKEKKEKKSYCVDCGKEIYYGSLRCKSCFYKKNCKCQHPSKEQLLFDIQTMSMIQVGKKYNVSDNAVRKWCKKYNILNKRKNKLFNKNFIK